MPLPPALLARLQKRGIIKQEEEIIAENYEGDSSKTKTYEENASGAPGCPNKYNPFHLCVEYCYDHWGDGMPEYRLPEKYVNLKNRMLAKFPLPDGWVEVYDAGVGKFYFWNKSTDEVCWLSPRHPRAYISDPAPRMAKENAASLFGTTEIDVSRDEDNAHRSRRRRPDGDRNRELAGENRGREVEKRERRRPREEEPEEDLSEMNDRDRMKRAKRKGIDPMDPAAYGDAPVGKWSDGLKIDAVTGVDVTASGPLFQQRPYPAPGAILRRQKPPGDDDDE
ncbi:unnamed protein product [Caenorhabditis angaria]|uniref:Polyglutamine-binding protein 1 n=1 Tax=Caenorhabditis angaria TaxID=860376 RepID=A0A9P1IM10_9PELO|nr:unnamed protein product [Caenorhabditis angaria]